MAPYPSMEGFTAKPVVARTVTVTYGNPITNTNNAAGDGWITGGTNTQVPTLLKGFEDEGGTAKFIEVDTSGSPDVIYVTPGVWVARFQCTLASHPPGFALTADTAAGTILAKLDQQGVAWLTNRNMVDYSEVFEVTERTGLVTHIASRGAGSADIRGMIANQGARLTLTKMMSR